MSDHSDNDPDQTGMASGRESDGPDDAVLVNSDSISRPDGRYLSVNTAPRGLPAWMGRGGDVGDVLVFGLYYVLFGTRRGNVVAVYRQRSFGLPKTVAFAYARTDDEASRIGTQWVADCHAGKFDQAPTMSRRDRRKSRPAD
jgi:hypothetical protein